MGVVEQRHVEQQVAVALHEQVEGDLDGRAVLASGDARDALRGVGLVVDGSPIGNSLWKPPNNSAAMPSICGWMAACSATMRVRRSGSCNACTNSGSGRCATS